MKGFGIIGLALLTVARGFAQAPPNDEFTNRTVLVGSSFTIAADTTGATFDYHNEPCYSAYLAPAISYDSLCGGPSLWWSWTPTQSTTVVIERADADSPARGYLMVYATANLSYDSQYDQVAGIYLPQRGRFAVFAAQAGKEYQISVASFEPKQLRFRFTATNTPIFRLQPRTETVSSGQSALFSAFAVGAKPICYQWQKDGVDILNATNHMLPMDNCSLGDAAGYRVVATSATGVSTSAVARLTVVTTESAAVLRALPPGGSNTFQFQLTGEEGRDYRIEFSTDLLSWGSIWAHGVIHNTNLATTFQVVKDAPAKFVRVSPYHAASESCINNLRQLRTAAWLFAEDHHLYDSSSTTLDDLSPYLAHAWTMMCPSGWSDYTPNNYCMVDVITCPTCQIVPSAHFLDEE